MFTDSIEYNLAVIGELLDQASTPEQRRRAKRAAAQIENVIVAIQKDNPKDNAVALGTAFAIYTIAQRLVQSSGGQADGVGGSGLILPG